MKNRKVLWIAQTAVLTASFGNAAVTGSMVNLILTISVMIAGLLSGLTVALNITDFC